MYIRIHMRGIKLKRTKLKNETKRNEMKRNVTIGSDERGKGREGRESKFRRGHIVRTEPRVKNQHTYDGEGYVASRLCALVNACVKLAELARW